jgi:hypothetical protein
MEETLVFVVGLPLIALAVILAAGIFLLSRVRKKLSRWEWWR